MLDGELADRQRAFAANNPLGDFVRALPVALRPVPPRVLAEVDRMQRDLRVVRFEVPEPFEEVAFWPLGIPGARVSVRLRAWTACSSSRPSSRTGPSDA